MGPGIDASQIFFARPREYDTRDKDRDDQRQLDMRQSDVACGHINCHTRSRADGPGRERKKSDVSKAADKDR